MTTGRVTALGFDGEVYAQKVVEFHLRPNWTIYGPCTFTANRRGCVEAVRLEYQMDGRTVVRETPASASFRRGDRVDVSVTVAVDYP